MEAADGYDIAMDQFPTNSYPVRSTNSISSTLTEYSSSSSSQNGDRRREQRLDIRPTTSRMIPHPSPDERDNYIIPSPPRNPTPRKVIEIESYNKRNDILSAPISDQDFREIAKEGKKLFVKALTLVRYSSHQHRGYI